MGIFTRYYGDDWVLAGFASALFALGGTAASLAGGAFFSPDEEAPKGEAAAQVQRDAFSKQVDSLIEREKTISATERLLLLTDPATKPDVTAALQKTQKERTDFSRDFYKVAFNLVLDPALIEEDSKALAKRLVNNTNSPLPTWYVNKATEHPLKLETTFLHECRAELGTLPVNIELAAEKLNSCSLEKDSDYIMKAFAGGVGGSMALYLGLPFFAAARRRIAEKKEEKEYQKKRQGHVPPRPMPAAVADAAAYYVPAPAPEPAKPVVVQKPVVKVDRLNLD